MARDPQRTRSLPTPQRGGPADVTRSLVDAAPVVTTAPLPRLSPSETRALGPNAAAPGPGAAELLAGRYELGEEIARGGMGVIVAARDVELRRELVIKFLEADAAGRPELLLRFVEEAQVQGQLEHPNICPVHEVGLAPDGRPFFAMKRVRGRSLEELLDELRAGAPPRPLPELLDVLGKVCDAVGFAHSRGVIHRDLKPGNVMVGEFGEVLVMDWGLAKLRDRAEEARVTSARAERATRSGGAALLTQEGSVLGTPSYMAPEQARGELERVDERTDIYALGGLLYALLTLRPPVTGRDHAEVLRQAAAGRVPAPSRVAPGVPAELEAVALKALARDPAERYESAAAFKADLVAYAEGRALSASSYGPLELLWKWLRRHRAVALPLLASAALLLVGGAAYLVSLSRALEREREARAEQALAAERATREATRATEAAAAERRAREAREEALAAAEAARATAEREAERAATAAAQAAAAEEDARRALARVVVAEGDRRLAAGEPLAARASYQAARDQMVTLGLDPLAAELGQWEAERRNPREAVGWRAHDRPIVAFAVARLGGRVATSDGREVRVHALDDGSLERVLPLAGARGLALSPDGLLLAVGTDRGASVWNAVTGERVRELPTPDPCPLYALAFTPSGARLLATGHKEPAQGDTRAIGFVSLFDLTSGEGVHYLPRMRLGAYAPLALEPTGERYAVFANGSQAWVIDLERTPPAPAFFEPAGGGVGTGEDITAVALFPPASRARASSRLIAAAGASGSIGLWSVELDVQRLSGNGGRLKRTLLGHQGGVHALAVTPDGSWLASGGPDATVRVWDPETGQVVHRMAGHHTIAIRDPVARRPNLLGITHLAFADRGATLVSAGADGTVRVWSLHTAAARPLAYPTRRARPQPIDAVTVAGELVISSPHDDDTRVWDAPTGTLLQSELERTSGGYVQLAVSPGGATLAGVRPSGGVELFELTTGERRNLPSPQGSRIAFAQGGRLLVVAGEGRLVAHDLLSGELRELRGTADDVAAVGSEHLLLAGREVRVTDLAGAPVRRFAYAARRVAASADGRWGLAAAEDGGVVALGLASGEVIPLEDASPPFLFSPDGRCAIVAGAGFEGSTLQVWEVASWRRLRILGGHRGHPRALAFGALLVSGDSRGEVIVWDLDVVRRVDAARARAANAASRPAALRAHAVAQAASERWAGALRLLTRAGEEGETAADVLLRARALSAVGREADARAAFERARDLAPDGSVEDVSAAVWLRANAR